MAMLGAVRALGVAAAVVLGAGCGPRPGTVPRAQPVPVQVTNRNRADVVIYVVRGGQQARLGTVVSGESRVLVIRNVPLAQLRDVSFDIRRIGAEGTFRTRGVSLGPEQKVVLRIEDLLSTSEVSVAENPAPGKQLP